MKIAVFGADGFIGRHVVACLDDHEVFSMIRSKSANPGTLTVDLLDKNTVITSLRQTRPDVVINCAGIVSNTDNVEHNSTFTNNILEAIHELDIPVKRVIILGSAGEYGRVEHGNIPVDEDVPLNAESGYGFSKLVEERNAHLLAKKYNIALIVARIFNPIGKGMHPRFLIPQIIEQVHDLKAGKRETLEVNRLDARRDYVAVKDVAAAIKVLAISTPGHSIYNIGSGEATSNKMLIDSVLSCMALNGSPEVIELSGRPEPNVAYQANITRIRTEFGWKPIRTVSEVIKEIIDASGY